MQPSMSGAASICTALMGVTFLGMPASGAVWVGVSVSYRSAGGVHEHAGQPAP